MKAPITSEKTSPSKGSKSKNKGNSFERDLSKLLSSIFNGSFIRCASSGAYVGGKNFIRKAVLSENQVRAAKGDISPPDFMPHFVVEAKNYNEFRFHQLFSAGRCPQLDEWVQQTLDCVDPGDVWFVCFKVTRVGLFVAVPAQHDYVFGNHCRYTGPHGELVITDLTEFFESNRERVLALSA